MICLLHVFLFVNKEHGALIFEGVFIREYSVYTSGGLRVMFFYT